MNTPRARGSNISFLGIDADFVDTYRLKLAAGRNFAPERAGHSAPVLLNETAARMFGWANPIGQRIAMPEAERSPVRLKNRIRPSMSHVQKSSPVRG